jgi:hypothetical protein
MAPTPSANDPVESEALPEKLPGSKSIWKFLGGLLDSKLWGHPIWRVIGTFLAIISSVTAVVHYTAQSVDFASAKKMWGIGSEVISVAGGFPGSKQYMNYQVKLADDPFPLSRVSAPFNNGNYFFFRSDLDFTRSISESEDEVMIAAITGELADWIRRPNVLFREVIGFNPTEQAWLTEQLRKIDQTPNTFEKMDIIKQFFQVDFEIDGVDATVSDVRREPHGYAIVYKQKKKSAGDPVHYHFTSYTVPELPGRS